MENLLYTAQEQALKTNSVKVVLISMMYYNFSGQDLQTKSWKYYLHGQFMLCTNTEAMYEKT